MTANDNRTLTNPKMREATGNEARIAQVADADGEVIALVEEVHDAVGQTEIHGHRGVERGEMREERCDLAHAEG